MSERRSGGLSADRAVSVREFSTALAEIGGFLDPPNIAVAVSGGADSLALTLLADQWVRERGGRLVALTVDHGLRSASAVEAARVAEWLGRAGIEHHILHRDRDFAPTGGLQSAARELRYRLLTEWCTAAGIPDLLLGHHLEDQAETFLLRLARGSGLYGLAAMAPAVRRGKTRLVRPLLAIPKARLRATLSNFGQDWIEDPSNGNSAFDRVRLRNAAPLLEQLGLTPHRIGKAARNLTRARQAIEMASEQRLAETVTFHPAGFARVALPACAQPPEEIALRALSNVITIVSGAGYPPRFDRLERLVARLRQQPFKSATLGGCRFLQHNGGVLICREAAALPPFAPLLPDGEVVWDRFKVKARGNSGWQMSIGAMGNDHVPRVREQLKPRARAAGIPWIVATALPALFVDGKIVQVPHLGWKQSGISDVISVEIEAWPSCATDVTGRDD